MTLRRTAFRCGAGIAILLGVAALALALAVYRPRLIRPWIERAMAPSGGTASLSALTVSLSPPAIALSGLAITPPPSGDGDILRLDYLRFELLPGSILHGGPWVRHLEARGVTYERRRHRKTEGPPDFTAVARLFDIEDLSLTDARLRMAIPQGVVSVDGLRLRLTPGEGGIRTFTGSGDLTFRGTGTPTLAAKFSARGTVTPEPALAVDLESASGRLEVGGSDIGGMLIARGRLSGPSLGKISGTVDGEVPRIERVRTYWAPLLPGSLAGVELTGRLPWRLSLSAGITERVLSLDLFPPDLGLSWPGAGLDCRFGGSINASGPAEEWLHGKGTLSGRVHGTGHFERPPMAIRRFRFDTSLAGAIAAPAFPALILSADPGEVLYERRPLPLGSLALRGSTRPVGDSYRVEGVQIRSGSLGRLTGQAAFDGGGNVSGRLDGATVPADNLVSLARAVSGLEWDDWSPTGAVDVAVRLEPAAGGPRVAVTAVPRRIGFTSPAGDVMGRKLSGKVDFEAHLTTRSRVNVELAVRQGEALWGTVYLDLAKDPLDLRVLGTVAGPGEYEDLLLEGGLGGFARLEIKGKARRFKETWRHQGRLALLDARLGPIFRTFLRDPLSTSHPDLAGLESDGTAGIALSFSGSGKTTALDGTLRLRSVDLHRGTEPALLSGLDIDLPISYSYGAANPALPAPSDTAKWGRLHLEKIRISGQELGPLEVPAILVPNRLYLGGAIAGSFFGADMSLRRIQVDEPLSGDFRVRMAAKLGSLDLSRIAGDNSALEGRIAGDLDPVIIGRERITAAGKLTGDLYGGRLDVSRVTVEHPFESGREIGADVNVDRIDLERLSGALGVGRITGRLSGSIMGLRMAYGQPVAFDLEMESVPAEGVDQSVSLKAVNSISLVGTGSALSGMGISLMATFFREFPYEKIGFGCGLKNDVFTVRGLIHKDGVEYLVKRRFFGGIDVINGNPDNRIGFSDMLERARRVTGERPD